MSNSPLVTYTKLSPNHSGLRKSKIDTITPHCIVGHLSLQTLGNVFAPKTRQASSNYGIDDQGHVGMYVEEKNRSWCTSSSSNDHRAVTIEIASDIRNPYKITDKAMQGLVNLSVDICRRNKIPQLLWRSDKKLIGQIDKQNITVHRWFSKTICPGDYIFSQLGYVADEVNKILLTSQRPPVKPPTSPNKPLFEYLVRVNVDSLNYRSGPGLDYSVRGSVKRGQVYTITAEAVDKNGTKWGKLKSGAGWVALAYTVKVG